MPSALERNPNLLSPLHLPSNDKTDNRRYTTNEDHGLQIANRTVVSDIMHCRKQKSAQRRENERHQNKQNERFDFRRHFEPQDSY